MKEREDLYSLKEILIILRSFTKYQIRRWWLILIIAVAGGCLGLGFYYLQKPKYRAVTTFLLEDKSAGSSGLAGLASQFGFSMGNVGGGGIFSGDNILDILRSKKVVNQVLLSPVDSGGIKQTLADLYLTFKGISKSWQKNPKLASINFFKGTTPITPLQDSVLTLIYQSFIKKDLLVERTRKQGTIIKVVVTSESAEFSRIMAERLVEEASKLYMIIRTGTAQESVQYFQRRADSLLILLNNKSFVAASAQPLDINPGLRSATVPAEINIRDKSLLATLYAEVVKNLEVSKVMLAQQTPVIQVLDRPEILLDNNKKGQLLLIVLFAVITLFIYGLISLLVFLFSIRKRAPL